jgi:hypothetical protein
MFRALTRLQRHNHTSLLAPNKTYAFLPTSTHTHFTPRRTTQVQLRMFALTPYRSNQPRTFSRQGELARLPVPEVRDSLERWLASLRPVVAEKVSRWKWSCDGEGEEGDWRQYSTERRA